MGVCPAVPRGAPLYLPFTTATDSEISPYFTVDEAEPRRRQAGSELNPLPNAFCSLCSSPCHLRSNGVPDLQVTCMNSDLWYSSSLRGRKGSYQESFNPRLLDLRLLGNLTIVRESAACVLSHRCVYALPRKGRLVRQTFQPTILRTTGCRVPLVTKRTLLAVGWSSSAFSWSPVMSVIIKLGL